MQEGAEVAEGSQASTKPSGKAGTATMAERQVRGAGWWGALPCGGKALPQGTPLPGQWAPLLLLAKRLNGHERGIRLGTRAASGSSGG